MNRKKESKQRIAMATQETSQQSLEVDKKRFRSFLHKYDDIDNWLNGGWETPPWEASRIKDFQRKLDAAFEAENGIILVWSGDRSYGDVFLNEKGEPERKPVLLFAEHKIEGTSDYVYVSAPRWLLMQVHHGSQLEAGWDDAAYTTDEYGARQRIRLEKPPEFFYEHFLVIANHEGNPVWGPCCDRMAKETQICYGTYREPAQSDVDYVGVTRQRMNEAGVFQRNDAERSAKILQDGAASTRYFIKRSQEQNAFKIQEMILNDPKQYLGDILHKKGSTMSTEELRGIVKEAFDEQNQRRFG